MLVPTLPFLVNSPGDYTMVKRYNFAGTGSSTAGMFGEGSCHTAEGLNGRVPIAEKQDSL